MTQNIYDDPEFFEGYSAFPRSREGLAGAPEWPTLRAMLPDMSGTRVLDLGCGFGAFARWARSEGADRVLGLDISEKMLARARSMTTDSRIEYRRGDMESLDLPDGEFDLVYSSLVFHYVKDFERLSQDLRRLLARPGRLVFSVEHPIFTAPSHPVWLEREGSSIWPLNNYLAEGERITHWITSGVVKYHRTIGSYVNALVRHGFQVIRIDEWGPTSTQIEAHPEWANEVHRPPFLLMSATVP